MSDPQSAIRNPQSALAWARLDSPVGRVYVAATEAGVCCLSHGALDDLAWERILAGEVGAPGVYDPAMPVVAQAVAELAEYFAGARQVFTVPVDLGRGRGVFIRRVLEELQQVPYGHLVSYGELARRAGQPRAARAAGAACKVTPVSILVPCHRVIHAAGDLGGWGGELWHKRALLELEGVRFSDGEAVRGAPTRWRPVARRPE
jgi:methylated-DNA-[protein]-cysteine S-methyltransferase